MAANECMASGCDALAPRTSIYCFIHEAQLEQAETQKRIAGALERIATALETQNAVLDGGMGALCYREFGAYISPLAVTQEAPE